MTTPEDKLRDLLIEAGGEHHQLGGVIPVGHLRIFNLREQPVERGQAYGMAGESGVHPGKFIGSIWALTHRPSDDDVSPSRPRVIGFLPEPFETAEEAAKAAQDKVREVLNHCCDLVGVRRTSLYGPSHSWLCDRIAYWFCVDAFIGAFERGLENQECALPWPPGCELTEHVPRAVQFQEHFPAVWGEARAKASAAYEQLSDHFGGDLGMLLEGRDDFDDLDDGVYRLAMSVLGHGVGWCDNGAEPISTETSGRFPHLEGPLCMWCDFQKWLDSGGDL